MLVDVKLFGFAQKPWDRVVKHHFLINYFAHYTYLLLALAFKIRLGL